MPHSTMAAIENLCIYTVKLTHSLRKIAVWCFNQKMIVIPHQAIGMAHPVGSLIHIIKNSKKGMPVFVRFINQFTPVSTRSHMVQGARKLQAQRSGHPWLLHSILRLYKKTDIPYSKGKWQDLSPDLYANLFLAPKNSFQVYNFT
ncbi:hypothetical protein Q668_17400 [Alcanivorax sp. PN-3]|nr:hypothetical protein Q668_17400 [Alcanivorax sp. PN-3]